MHAMREIYQRITMQKDQGVSNITIIKEAQIYGAIKTRLLQRKNAYWIRKTHIFDIFSGDGMNIVDGEVVWGSPIETLYAIIHSGISRYSFIASDIRSDAVERLEQRMGDLGKHTDTKFQTVDAASQIKHIRELMRNHPSNHTLVIIDPNGPGVMPFKEMRVLSQIYSKRVDIFLNISETAINRILRCGITKNKNWWAEYESFSSIILDIFKHYKQAWVRKVIIGDRQKWRFICFWSYAPTKSGWDKQGLISVPSKQEMEEILKGAGNVSNA